LYQVLPPPSPSGRARLVLAERDEATVGRQHLLLEPLSNDRVRITNISSRSTVQIGSGDPLTKNQAQEYELPSDGLVVRLGDTRVIRVSSRAQAESAVLHRLDYPSAPPGAVADEAVVLSPPAFAGANLDKATQLSRLGIVLDVLQSALGPEDFYRRAAQAVVTVAGMDEGHVLLWENQAWSPKASEPCDVARGQDRHGKSAAL
jgi:hypothetical protein